MRSILNNPWVVAGLCCVALGVISWNLIPEGRAKVEQQEVKPVPVTSLDRQPSYDIALLGWIDQPTRDPFRLGGISQPTQALLLAQAAFPIADLHIHGIAMNPGAPMAMINGTFVAEGDTIEGYRVAQIQPDGVWLDGPHGREQLRF